MLVVLFIIDTPLLSLSKLTSFWYLTLVLFLYEIDERSRM